MITFLLENFQPFDVSVQNLIKVNVSASNLFIESAIRIRFSPNIGLIE